MNIVKISFCVALFSIACKTKKTQVASNSNGETTKTTSPSSVTLELIEGLNLGNKAPEFKQIGVDGKDISLSSTKGKVILIDFWASWCGPCRMENPAVVGAYIKYKNSNFKNGKGFDIFSVSLDQSKEAWLKAIEKDNLVWKNHTCDMLSWNNAVAKLYGVNSIPTNFLINGEGIIIGKGLRGKDLENALEDYLKK